MVTLLSLRTQARQRADMENSRFIEDPELNGYINASIAELYDILVSRYSDYYTAEYEYTVSSGGSTIPLPELFYKLRGLDMNTGGNFVTLRKFNFEDRNRWNNAFPYVRQFAPGVQYRVFGSNIILTPKENADGLYRVYYIPKFVDLVDDTDEFDGINGYEEYVVVDTAIKMLQKEESDVSVLVMQKQALLNRIEAMAAERDAGEPEHITDMSRLGYGSDDDGWF